MVTLCLNLSDYKWTGLSSLAPGTAFHERCASLLRNIDWVRLTGYASQLQGGTPCRLEDPISIGGRHIVCILSFTDEYRWVVRFRIPELASSDEQKQRADSLMLQEVHCLQLIARQTSIPVASVMGYGTSDSGFGAPFILMECLPGNCAMDINFDFIPEQYKSHFFQQMAKVHVQMSALTFPRIGTIILDADGTVEIGPIPGIGGPFDTATEFLCAWAAVTDFPLSEDRVRRGSGPFADEVWQGICDFPRELSDLAALITHGNNEGPFPLIHTDYGHNNIIVDDEYNMLGVIDWEHAIAGPWAMVQVPLTVRTIPAAMDIPTNYNSDGTPKSPTLQAKYAERDEYLQAVKEAEFELDISPKLSRILCDANLQNVTTAMKFFAVDGKLGFYSRVLEAYRRLRDGSAK